MNTKTTVEYNSSDIKEIKSTWDENEANTLLATGNWILAHAGLAHKDTMGFMAKPCYILARIK